MKMWKQGGIFLLIWIGFDAILLPFIGWIAGLVGIVLGLLIVMRLGKKYPNVQKKIDRRETKEANDNIKEIKRQYIIEHGKKAWRKQGKKNLKRAYREEYNWLKKNDKIQEKERKEREKERMKQVKENRKAW